MTPPLACEDAEVLLSEMATTRSIELEMHLQACESCRQTAQLFSLAALPEPTNLEQAKRSKLPELTLSAFQRAGNTRSAFQRFIGYAVAACLGALVASAGMLSMRAPQRPQQSATPAASLRPPADLTLAANDLLFSDWEPDEDELLGSVDDFASYEVSWPVITEGEEQ